MAGYPLAGLLALALVSCGGAATRTSSGSDVAGSLRHHGRDRTYFLHIPDSYADTPAPLVVALHGGGGVGHSMVRLTGLSGLSDRRGFLVVYPDAVAKTWNDGRAVQKYESHRENVDDVGFIAELLDRLAQQFAIDEDRVYVTGISNGAMMAHRLACELTDRIAAIAPVAGAMPSRMAARCTPSAAIAVLVLNGTEDELVPWEGGHVRLGRKRLGQILSAPETTALWASLNGCAAGPRIGELPDRDPEDGTRIYRHVHANCRDGASVELYEIRGGGHTWPGGWRYLPEFLIGKTSQDIDATEAIWTFFEQK